MYPYYKLSTGLTDDDIAGIRALYGSNVGADACTDADADAAADTYTDTAAGADTATCAANGQETSLRHRYRSSRRDSRLRLTAAAAMAISGTASDNVGVTAVKWTNSTGDAGMATGTTVVVGEHTASGRYERDYGAGLRCGRATRRGGRSRW